MDEAQNKIAEDAQNHIRKMFYNYPWKIVPISKYRLPNKEQEPTPKTPKPQE